VNLALYSPLEVRVNTPLKLSQAQIHAVQEQAMKSDSRIEPVEEHYFADGVYARVMKVPAGALVIGKAHRTKHIAIMLKGKANITSQDGTVVELSAPAIFTVEPGAKKVAAVLEEMWFVNIHPTDTEDLDIIESRVIIPEEEHRLMHTSVPVIEGDI